MDSDINIKAKEICLTHYLRDDALLIHPTLCVCMYRLKEKLLLFQIKGRISLIRKSHLQR